MAEVLEKKVLSRHVKKALENFAQENFLPAAECDFTLLKTHTYIKSNANNEFEHFAKKVLDQYLNKDKILNEHVEFQQHHNFTLHALKECKLKLDYTIEFYEHASHPKMVLSPNSIIPYKLYKPQELLKLLFEELNKIKAYHGILTRVFDETMIKNLKVLVKYIYTGKFTKKVKIVRNIEVILGDVCYPKSEALIIPINSICTMKSEKAAKISKAGLGSIRKQVKEFKDKNKKIKLESCFSTGSGRLNRRGLKKIYYSVIKNFQNDFNSLHIVRNALYNEFVLVVNDKMKDVIVPVFLNIFIPIINDIIKYSKATAHSKIYFNTSSDKFEY